MSTYCHYYYLFLLHFLLPSFARSCPAYNFSCGNFTLEVQFPFYSTLNPQCGGLHFISCINLVPVVKLHGQNFVYPVGNLSYEDKNLIILDLKVSSYLRNDCVFLYDFVSPISNFNVSNFPDHLSYSQQLFNCTPNSYDYSHDLFKELYNLSPCKDYSIYYSRNSEDQNDGDFPEYCATTKDVWFDWELLFDESGGVSLISAGFSRKWTQFSDCFSCKILGANCKNSTCECSNNQCRRTGDKSSSSSKVIAGVICGVLVFIIACCLSCFYYKRKLRRNSTPTSSTNLVQSISNSKSFSKKDLEPIGFHGTTPLFHYEELKEATNGFDPSNELGDGGYGTVYKGFLRDGRVVAVKRLYETSYKRVEAFMNEVEILSRLRHPNLVTLYGSTSPNSPHLLLVYEYIPNGTLADHLHNPKRSQSLPLSLRLSMAIDAAAALSYLHSVDIIHRDIKSHNILIDNNFNVKMADFGLSRLFPPNATHVSTAPQGTPGYLDPEYHRFYQLTDKSDVYSFGVVLMELLSARPAVDIDRKPNEISLAMTAVNKIQKGELAELVDAVLGFESDAEANRVVTQMAELAFRCLQMDRDMRPSIKEVLAELREIEKGGCCKNGDFCEIKVKEEARLLRDSGTFSPDTVMNNWTSRSTTPNSSNQGII